MGTFDDVFNKVKKPGDPKPAAESKPAENPSADPAPEGKPQGKAGAPVSEAFKKTFGERKS